MEEELGLAEMVEVKGLMEVLAGGEARKDRSRHGWRIKTCRLQVIMEGPWTSTSVRHQDPQAVPQDKGARAWLLASCERTNGAANRKLWFILDRSAHWARGAMLGVHGAGERQKGSEDSVKRETEGGR